MSLSALIQSSVDLAGELVGDLTVPVTVHRFEGYEDGYPDVPVFSGATALRGIRERKVEQRGTAEREMRAGDVLTLFGEVGSIDPRDVVEVAGARYRIGTVEGLQSPRGGAYLPKVTLGARL